MSFSNELAVLHTGSCDVHYSVYHKTSFRINEHGFSSYAPKAFGDLHVYCQLHTARGNRRKGKYSHHKALPSKLTPKVTFLLSNTQNRKQYSHCHDEIYNAVEESETAVMTTRKINSLHSQIKQRKLIRSCTKVIYK